MYDHEPLFTMEDDEIKLKTDASDMELIAPYPSASQMR